VLKILPLDIASVAVLPQWSDLLTRSDVNLFIVATPPKFQAEIALAAIGRRQNMCWWKNQAQEIQRNYARRLRSPKKKRIRVRVGFNTAITERFVRRAPWSMQDRWVP